MSFRITRVYTRQGDKGETRLGGGQAVPKDSVRIRTYGTIDELNSAIGVVLAHHPVEALTKALTRIQHQLFTLGGDLCVLEEDKKNWEMEGIEESHVTFLEQLIDVLNEELTPLKEFILPGGSTVAALLHQARCICRRAETLLVEMLKSEETGPFVLAYINRLSDALFMMARYQNHATGVTDVYWRKNDDDESQS